MTTNEATTTKIQASQRLRLRRLGMTIGSYALTMLIVSLGAGLGYFDWHYVGDYVLAVVVINLLFYAAIRSGFNLRFREPSLTIYQMGFALLPSLWVMYHIDHPQIRTASLLVAILPILYGILGLQTVRLVAMGLLTVIAYIALISLMHANRVDIIDPKAEMVVVVALLIVMTQISLIGGYIASLRQKVARQNDDLSKAMTTISDMANRDTLTGIWNRRYLQETLEQELQRCNRGAPTFSLCLLDLDHFKQINDTYGHVIGDEVLRRVAEIVQQQIRSIDCFGRFGGEEFLLVLPQTTIDGARIKAERLREAIEKIDIIELGQGVRVTVSIGVAQIAAKESLKHLIIRADKAMYVAKTQGRNQVACDNNALPSDDEP